MRKGGAGGQAACAAETRRMRRHAARGYEQGNDEYENENE